METAKIWLRIIGIIGIISIPSISIACIIICQAPMINTYVPAWIWARYPEASAMIGACAILIATTAIYKHKP